MSDETIYWLGFSSFPGVGPVLFEKLLKTFGTAKNAWHATSRELLTIIGEKKTKDFLLFRETFDFDIYCKRLERTHVTVITLQDDSYPTLLKQIKNPPFVLYVKALRSAQGKKIFDFNSEKNKKIVAVVGTRKMTQYGRDVTELFTSTLSNVGCVIVSGLAMGVDAVAHQKTIDEGGKTIAVLGCGVDCCSPAENLHLYDEIIDAGGSILSDVPLGMSPSKGSFPARNRIVAGLSDGVLVTEGAEDSGALITANYAFDFERKVFAVPGSITSSLSKGPYKLIEKGAVLVTKPEDILHELQITNVQLRIENSEKIQGDTEEEQEIVDLLQSESLPFDQLVLRTKLDSSKLATTLSMMELKGLIKSKPGGFYTLREP